MSLETFSMVLLTQGFVRFVVGQVYIEKVFLELEVMLPKSIPGDFRAGNLRHFIKLAGTFPDREKVYALRRK